MTGVEGIPFWLEFEVDAWPADGTPVAGRTQPCWPALAVTESSAIRANKPCI